MYSSWAAHIGTKDVDGISASWLCAKIQNFKSTIHYHISLKTVNYEIVAILKTKLRGLLAKIITAQFICLDLHGAKYQHFLSFPMLLNPIFR